MLQFLVLRERKRRRQKMAESAIGNILALSIPFLPFVDPAAVANAASSSSHEHDTDGVSNVVDEAEIATHATLEEHVSDDNEGEDVTFGRIERFSPH